MNQDPYAAPQSDLKIEKNIDVPEEITKKIRSAWIAGVISISITTVLTLISMSGADILGLNAAAFIDVGLMAVFAFGIYKNSRTCAVLMLLLFLANKILMWLDSGQLNGIIISLVFLWFFTQGVIGTFQYHKYIKCN